MTDIPENRRWMHVSFLLPGDVMWGCRVIDGNGQPKMTVPWETWERVEMLPHKGTGTFSDRWIFPITDHSDPNRPRESYRMQYHEMLVYRPSWYRAAVPSSQHWNGKCGRCGSRTYTGFSTVEHEGGQCRT